MTGPPGADLLRAELRRVVSTRLWWVALPVAGLLAVLVGTGGAAVASLAADAELVAPGDALPSSIGVSTAYAVQGAWVLALALGAVAGTTELRHGTLAGTYLASPRRGAVLVATVAGQAAAGAVLAVVVVLGCLAGGLLGGDRTPPLPGYLGWAVLDVVAVAAWAAIGAAVGTAVGNQVVAVATSVLGVLALGPLLGPGLVAALGQGADVVLPPSAAVTLTRALPLQQLSGDLAALTPAATELEAGAWWVGGVVLVAWTAGALAVAHLVVRRREVG